MSDSEKLRKSSASIWLATSFIFFTFTVFGFWLAYLAPIIMIGGVVPIVFFWISFVAAINSYETYVGVSEDEIREFDSARLKKLNGIVELLGAYVFLALAISCIWIMFLFLEAIWPLICILFWVFIAFFINCIKFAINNFIEIRKIVKK